MAAEPQTPTWATDGTLITEPPSGLKATGWVPGQKPPAQFFNWLLNLFCQWIAFFSFLNGTLLWTKGVFCYDHATAGSPWFIYVGTINLLKIAGYVFTETDIPALSIDDVRALDVISHVHSGTTYRALYPEEWYYIYLYVDGGVLRAEITTVAPVGIWRGGGGTTHRYVGTFRTDDQLVAEFDGIHTGTPIPFVRSGQDVMYVDSGFTGLGTFDAASSHDVDLTSRVPSTAGSLVMLGYTAMNSAGSGGAFNLGVSATVIFQQLWVPASTPAGYSGFVKMPCDNNRHIRAGGATVATTTATLNVAGFVERWS